jgi:hypothetical protein
MNMKQAASRDLLAACLMMVSCVAYSSTLKMETLCSSETSVDFHRTTWLYIIDEKKNNPSNYNLVHFS